ncbi:MAG TPA: hypothetical protein VK978_03860 [Candidatus Saccharimonadales bacterium]|nr:hypothetical protein [Candidatus Saccharimonadales bacterium]
MTIHEIKLSQEDEDLLAKVSRFNGYNTPDKQIATALRDYVWAHKEAISEQGIDEETGKATSLPVSENTPDDVGTESTSHLIDLHPNDEAYIATEVLVPGIPIEATVGVKASRIMSEFLRTYVEEVPESLHPEF